MVYSLNRSTVWSCEVYVLLNEVKWDILGITETHLTESTPDNLLRLPGFDFVTKDIDLREEEC